MGGGRENQVFSSSEVKAQAYQMCGFLTFGFWLPNIDIFVFKFSGFFGFLCFSVFTFLILGFEILAFGFVCLVFGDFRVLAFWTF